MQIVVKGHRTKVPDRFRRHVHDKLAKVERLGSRIIGVDVKISRERNPRQSSTCERVEITVRSRGPVVRAEACAPDSYAALDRAWGKLEARLRKLKDKRKIHRGSRAPVSVSEATAPLAEDLLPQPGGGQAARPQWSRSTDGVLDDDHLDDTVIEVPTVGEGPLVVREKTHTAGPMSIEDALLAMELVGHDFYLFRDTATRQPSVVYRRRAYDYGVIRLVDSSVDKVAGVS